MQHKIIDEFTDLSISRQRKEQLRHPEKTKERVKRWEQSEAGKASKRRRNMRYAEKLKLSTGKTIDNGKH